MSSSNNLQSPVGDVVDVLKPLKEQKQNIAGGENKDSFFFFSIAGMTPEIVLSLDLFLFIIKEMRIKKAPLHDISNQCTSIAQWMLKTSLTQMFSFLFLTHFECQNVFTKTRVDI